MRGQTERALVTGGIGGNVSGVFVPRWDAEDRIKFAVNAGSGIGRYIADLSSLGGQDAVYDPVQAASVRFESRAGTSAMSTPGRRSSPRP